MVIFYDGVNDTYTAYQQQVAGLPQNEFNRVKEFNAHGRTFVMDLWLTFADNLSTIRFLKGAIYRQSTGDLSGNAARPIPPNSPDQSVMNKEVLARDVVDIYERRLKS